MWLLLIAAFQAVLFAQVATPGGACCHALEVGPVVMTVADMDRSLDFYSQVLNFQKVSDTERSGPEFDQLYGLSNAHIRAVDLKLGDDTIELLQFIGIAGALMPADVHQQRSRIPARGDHRQ